MDAASEPWIQSSPSSTSHADATKPSLTQKKPRHRHSPAQLAALNELFEKTEHPSLEQRISLAERLGMYVLLFHTAMYLEIKLLKLLGNRETKTVNAWFQNKRASSKKRSRNHLYNDSRQTRATAAPPPSSASSSLPHIAEFDDYHDDEIPSLDLNQSRLVPDLARQHHHSAYISGNGDAHQFVTETESTPRRMRALPSTEQIDELKRMYDIDPHPSTELRQALSERLGM
jgi:hypothetical protein